MIRIIRVLHLTRNYLSGHRRRGQSGAYDAVVRGHQIPCFEGEGLRVGQVQQYQRSVPSEWPPLPPFIRLHTMVRHLTPGAEPLF